ncbi:Ribose-5-phosphate isomerase B [Candidatus Bealeia paramacronuclearis]|uniref:Ribose-5-phosphate isomerase B n=1 Tax=Candidatus Bealeia paramacronuclearis TaxID=1921001 RepID=A0ABZ2C781_9PROT|nr:Ribose-5-phosphate isomerase B [Candidatus Bealeia paramacronuclearis]
MTEDISTLINIVTALPNPKKTLVFGSDHAGFVLKEYLKTQSQAWSYNVIDCGTHSEDSVDYPDYVPPVVKEVLAGARGVLICGSGIGMSIAANRYKGIRAALCADPLWAKLAREHNDANILVLGERLLGQQEAIECLRTFLNIAFEGGRHLRRVEKIDS